MSKKMISLVLALMLMCVGAMALAADEYQITFYANSGSGEMAGATVPAGGSYTLPACSFIPPEGMVFKRWMTAGFPAIMPGDTITVNSDLTILPAWVDEQYTVVLDPNLGDGKTYSETYQHDEEFYLPNGEEADLPFTMPEGKIIWNWVLQTTGDDFEPGMYYTGHDGMVFKADWADAEWQENSYSVQLVVGEWSDERTSPEGTEFMLPNLRQLPCKDNFSEDAWIDYWTVDGVKYAPGSRLVLAQDTIATATLGEESTVVYMVMFSANGGSGSRIPMEVSAGTAIILPENPYTAPEGKQFKAWQIGTQQYAAGDSVTVTGEMTVSAVWETKVCKVTFDLNGVEGSYPVQEVEYGKQYTLPEPDEIVEVPEHLNFNGWKIGDNKYGPGYSFTVTDDVTVVAQWKERLVSITYLNDDGEEIKVIGDLAYGTEHEELTPEAVGLTVPNGYELDYWQVLNTRLEVIDTAYVGDDEPLVLYSNWLMKAVWKEASAVQYTITFDANGGTGAMAPMSVKDGESFQFPVCGFTPPEGKVFKAWAYNGAEYIVGLNMNAYTDMVLTAIWQDDTIAPTYYTISINFNGAKDQQGKEEVIYNAQPDGAINLPHPVTDLGATEPTGKQFKAWLIDGEEYTAGTYWVVTGNLVCTAIWEDIPVENCVITYQENDGSSPKTHTVSVAAGTKYTVLENFFDVPQGMAFDCWMLDGTRVKPGEQITISGDITLIAGWSKSEFTITYKSPSGAVVEVPIVAGEGHVLRENMFVEPVGMEFRCWLFQVPPTFTEVEELEPGTEFTSVRSDLTFIADWQPKVCEITFDLNGVEGSYPAQAVEYGQSYTLPEPDEIVEVPEHLNFNGWKIGDNKYGPGYSFTVTDDVTVVAQWKERLVSITYLNDNGETIEEIGDLAYGTEHVELTPEAAGLSVPEGYVFDYWQVLNTRLEVIDTAYVGDGQPLVLYSNWLMKPSWKIKSYEISFETSISSDGMTAMDSVFVNHGQDYTLPTCTMGTPGPNREFSHWLVDGVSYQPGDKIASVTKDTIVSAEWKIKTFTVVYKSGSTVLDTVSDVPYGQTLNVKDAVADFGLTAPEGFSFNCWIATDANGKVVGEAYTDPEWKFPVLGNYTLTPNWVANDETKVYTLYFNMNGGDPINPLEVRQGAYFELPPLQIIKHPAGLEFDYFDVGGKQYNPHDLFLAEKDVTAVAYWKGGSAPAPNTVSFNANGGSGTMNAVSVQVGDSYTLPACSFTAPTGYRFMHWEIDGAAYLAGETIGLPGDVTLTAQWAPMELAVTFDPGDRGGNSVTQTQSYGVAFNLPYLSDFGWDDYLSGSVFLGWNLNGQYLGEGAAFTATADMTLTAMWADRYYTITIKDSNESAAPKSVTVEYGDSYTLKNASDYGFAPKDSRIHVFENWMRTSDQKTFSVGDTISGITRSMAFEAKWTFGTIVEVEDKETGEIVETVVEVEVKTQPEEIDQNDASVMNTSDPSKLPEQLGNMLSTLQKNTAGAEATGGVVIETMQDVVDALHESINGTVTTETEELEYPAENIAVTDIVPVLEIEIDGVVEKIEITDKSLMPDDTGIEVALEIPAGTDPATHQYKITHMLTQDAWDGSNKKAGDIETLTVHRYDDKYLYVMMKNFSPVAIAWKELPAEVVIPDSVIEELPQTGDPSSLLAWVTLLGASGIGLRAMKRRKK